GGSSAQISGRAFPRSALGYLGPSPRCRAGEAGANFLTDVAQNAAREREGRGVHHRRTFGNMLSSQAMCLNIFGPLATAEGLGTLAGVSADMGLPVQSVRSVDIEYIP